MILSTLKMFPRNFPRFSFIFSVIIDFSRNFRQHFSVFFLKLFEIFSLSFFYNTYLKIFLQFYHIFLVFLKFSLNFINFVLLFYKLTKNTFNVFSQCPENLPIISNFIEIFKKLNVFLILKFLKNFLKLFKKHRQSFPIYLFFKF